LFLITPLVLLGAIGHVVLWVGLVNRLHGVAWNRKMIDALTAFCGFALVALPMAAASIFWLRGPLVPPARWDGPHWAAWSWLVACAILGVMALGHWLWRRSHPEIRGGLVANHTTELDVRRTTVEPLTAPGLPRLLSHLPYNQVVRPWLHEKKLELPRLTARYAGLRIVHLSDLHLSGRITPRYFEEVFERVNAWDPDLTVVTGDIVERQHCLDWVPTTLGRLRATNGVYFVLGNHDQKVDCRRLRSALVLAGLVDLGGRFCRLEIDGRSLILAGNELPWFAPAADVSNCPPHDADGMPLRILLAHSPDQFGWAQDRDFDLVLAGHCHGGQVRFPIVGAVLAPSLHGTRYAAGVFRRGDTVMHVSRGTSGLAPFRFNCPPEVTLLELSAGKR
jgi:predicted MPP superfamily phosphohydrolase